MQSILKSLALPDEAVQWLMMLWNAIQVFDDVADGDTVSRKALDRAIWDCLVGMHNNHFWRQASGTLMPVVALMVLKWQGSDAAERAGEADEKSFMWRAGFYDVVMMVVQVVHGEEQAIKLAPVVMSLYGERLNDYMVEFQHA